MNRRLVAVQVVSVLVVAILWAVVSGALGIDPTASFLIGMVLGGLAVLIPRAVLG